MLLQGPAETTNYMILGFDVLFVPMLAYVWSLAARRKKLLRELDSLQELEKK